VALRPNSVRLELWSGIVLGLLGLLSVVLSLAGADIASASAASVGSILEPVVVLLLLLGTWRRVYERSQNQPDAHKFQERRLLPTSATPALRRDLNDVRHRADVSGTIVAVGVPTDLWSLLAKKPTSDREVKEQLQAVLELICEQRSARAKR
ncbi:membrane-associated protein, putative, partial [Bodo saltans]